MAGSWCLSFGSVNSTQVHFSPLLSFSLGNLVLLAMRVPKISDIKYLTLSFIFPVFILDHYLFASFYLLCCTESIMWSKFPWHSVSILKHFELKEYTGKNKFFWRKFSKAPTPKSQPPVWNSSAHAWNSSASVRAEKAKQKDGKSWTKYSQGVFLFCFGLLSSKNGSVFLFCGLHSQQTRTGVNSDLCQRDQIKLYVEGTRVSLR